eukprot:gene4017-4067_t
MLTYAAEHGFMSDWHFAHYAKFALGGAGLIMIESTKADPRGCTTPRDPGLWKDDFIPAIAKIAQFAKSQGATVGIQLGHSGRKARNSVPWEGRLPLGPEQKGVDHGEEWELIAPSAIAAGVKSQVPHELSVTEIHELIETFGQAVLRAEKAGLDIVEVHGAHGYLVHQFCSEHANQRTDAYGGSFNNRMRFALELIEHVRSLWPQGKPLFYRISAVDEQGWSIEDSVKLCRELKLKGVDMIDCSSGGMSEGSVMASASRPGFGYQVPYAQQIRAEAGIMTQAVGLIIHADQAEKILRQGQADMVAIGREMLNNPHWAFDAANKLGDESAFKTIPANYSYWLEKRAGSGFGKNTSTWAAGISQT